MKHFGICPGSCGEFIQGMLEDSEYLVSYAVNMYSKAQVEEKSENIRKGPYKARKALQEVFKYFNLDVKDTKNISLNVKSNIPIGKGMASSTADIGATINAALSFLGKELDSHKISKIAAKVEPTDSIFIENNCIFNPLKGEVLKELGYVDGIKVLVLEPNEKLNTQSIRRKQDYFLKKQDNKEKIKQAFKTLEEGFKNNDLKLIGKAATISSILNENIHKKDGLHEIIKITEEFGAYGVNIAHSGTVIGIILDKEMNHKKLEEKLILRKLNKKYKKIYSLDVIRGGVRGGELWNI
ncbi:GHMP family kinase ATP-binding protein [Tepidibacter formicigenes]|jgi:L-threonine kinase|uniref:Threonine kinase n=1 Tax=Tepidibacter formicigenes DSM 15518 TaxID=1123349 RepID=A0A1M6RHY2_9FIRM|nr:cobalamin biosynthesis protein [Tepidibacter formicigenes]SHK32016.1 threonine kinase [Tepidibacter formicigenes DSM 15518]